MGHADTFPNPALAPDPTTREHWLLRYLLSNGCATCGAYGQGVCGADEGSIMMECKA